MAAANASKGKKKKWSKGKLKEKVNNMVKFDKVRQKPGAGAPLYTFLYGRVPQPLPDRVGGGSRETACSARAWQPTKPSPSLRLQLFLRRAPKETAQLPPQSGSLGTTLYAP
jgi:hypothetical protein